MQDLKTVRSILLFKPMANAMALAINAGVVANLRFCVVLMIGFGDQPTPSPVVPGDCQAWHGSLPEPHQPALRAG